MYIECTAWSSTCSQNLQFVRVLIHNLYYTGLLFFLAGLRTAELTTSLCIATDDTVRSAVLSPLSSVLKRALYFRQDTEATAHSTVVITSSVFTARHLILTADWSWSYCSLVPLRIPVGQCDGQASTAIKVLIVLRKYPLRITVRDALDHQTYLQDEARCWPEMFIYCQRL